MATPNEAYNAGAVPHSGITVEIFRPTDPASPGTGSSLGNYKITSITPNQTSTLNKRPDVDGGKNGWWLVTGDTEGSAEIQRAIATTPSLQTGDYFLATLRVNAAGSGVQERFVIHNPSAPVDASYRRVSCSIIVDPTVYGA